MKRIRPLTAILVVLSASGCVGAEGFVEGFAGTLAGNPHQTRTTFYDPPLRQPTTYRVGSSGNTLYGSDGTFCRRSYAGGVVYCN